MDLALSSKATWACLALALAACATGPKVVTDSDPSTNFGRYRTYSWVYSGSPRGMNPLLFQRVQQSIDRSLAARSFQPGDPGDFAVAFTLGRRDRVEVTDFGSYGPFYRGWGWGGAYRNVDIRNVTDGTLVIDVYDVASKKAVWHGVATQEVSSGQADQAKIDAAVDAVIAQFPAGSAPPAN